MTSARFYTNLGTLPQANSIAWMSCTYGPGNGTVSEADVWWNNTNVGNVETLCANGSQSYPFAVSTTGLLRCKRTQIDFSQYPVSNQTSLTVAAMNINGQFRYGLITVASTSASGYPAWPTQWWAGGTDPSTYADPPSGTPITAAEQYGGTNPSVRQACSCSGDPVNTNIGNFFAAATDITIPGRGPGLVLNRTYNSLAASTDGLFGFGWSFNYGMSSTTNGATVTITQENGSTIAFTSSGGTYTPTAPRFEATLSSDGTLYTFTRRAREIFKFNMTSGQLVSIADLNGHPTALSWSGSQLAAATDSANRTLTFSYTGSNITKVADSAGRSVTFAYTDGSGNLNRACDLNNNCTSYTYDFSHRMLTIQKPRGGSTTNHYSSSGQVDQQTVLVQQTPTAINRITTFAYNNGTTTITDPKGNLTLDTYSNGQLTTQTHGYGTPQAARWVFSYDPTTLGLASVTDPNLNVWKKTFDPNGNLLTTIDPLGDQAQYTYDSFDDVLTATDPLFMQYNAQHNTSYATTFHHDDPVRPWNLTSTSRPLLNAQGAVAATQTSIYGYDPTSPGDVSSVTDPDTNVWRYSYDGAGDLQTVTDPITPTADIITYCYDSIGRRTRTITPRGTAANVTCTTSSPTNTYQYSYDAFGHVLTATDPLGHQTTKSYDADENLQTSKDGNLNTRSYAYDLADEPTQINRADGTNLQNSYWPDGTLKSQTDGAGQPTSYTYDAVAHLQTVTDPLSRVTTYSIDGTGNELTKQDPGGNCSATPKIGCTTFGYDTANRLASVMYSDGATPNISGIVYDADNQRTSMTDGWGTSTWTWDSLHRMTQSTTRPAGGTTTSVGYGYDLRNDETSIAYPNAVGAVRRGYDPAGRLHTVSDWASHTTTFSYDADSFLQSQAYPDGTTATFTPDAADRVMGITDSGAPNLPSFSYGRDANDQVTSVSSSGIPADNHSYGYTQLNQLASQDAAQTSYDSSDNPTILSNGTRQGFDAANQLSNPSVTFVNSTTTAASGVATFSLPNGIQPGDEIFVAVASTGAQSVATPAGYSLVGSFYSSDAATCWVGCTSSSSTIIGHQVGGGTASASASEIVLFQRTATGNDPSVTVGQNATSQEVVTIAAYRGVATLNPIDAASSTGTTLGTTVTPPAINNESKEQFVTLQAAVGWIGSANWTPPQTPTPAMSERSQAADGQIVSGGIADKPATTSGSSSSLTSTFSQTSNLVGVTLALKSLQYSFDGRGNRTQTTPVASSAVNLTYDQANRLIGYGSNATYAYNGDGLRMSKTTSGTTTQQTWDVAGGMPMLLQDTSAAATTSYIYGAGGLPIEQVGPNGTLYYHQDQLGSTRALTDQSGNVIATYSYDPYGNPTGSTGSISSSLGFAGQYTDAESGLIYMRARYYDPTTAQFISRDPMAAITRSTYGYASSSPLNFTDPTGFAICLRDGGACGGINSVAKVLAGALGGFNKPSDDYLKSLDIDPHQFKEDIVGRSSNVSKYDIYQDKSTGDLYVGPKQLDDPNSLEPGNTRIVNGKAYDAQPGEPLPAEIPPVVGGSDQPPMPGCEASYTTLADGCLGPWGDLFGGGGGGEGEPPPEIFDVSYNTVGCGPRFFT